MDLQKLRQEAIYVATEYEGYAQAVAQSLLWILDHPEVVLPAGHRIVKSPELLGKGVPQR